MDADCYMDCPCCDSEYSVRIDCINDIYLHCSGEISSDVTGHCNICGKDFKDW